MINRLLVFLLLFSLACASLGLLHVILETNDSMTLADLVSRDYDRSGPREYLKELVRSVRDGSVLLANLDRNLFYAVFAGCGVLLALRVVVSLLKTAGIKRFARSQATSAHNTISATSKKLAAEAVRPARSLKFDAPTSFVGIATEQSEFMVRRSGGVHLLSTRWPRRAPYGLSLTGKMIFTFTAIIAVFGSLTLLLIYFTLASSLTNQSIQRARLIALNVRDSLPAYLLKKDTVRLRAFLRKYASRPGMAYILVEDRKGEIFSHSFAVLPQQMQNTATSDRPRNAGSRLFRLEDGMVHEVGIPVLEGQIGNVRVGVWKDEIDDEIGRTVMPIVEFIVLVFCAGFLMAIFLARRITRPIGRLVRTARRVSEGELDVPSTGVNDTGEFGELSRSFERMRSSVKAAMTRLDE